MPITKAHCKTSTRLFICDCKKQFSNLWCRDFFFSISITKDFRFSSFQTSCCCYCSNSLTSLDMFVKILILNTKNTTKIWMKCLKELKFGWIDIICKNKENKKVWARNNWTKTEKLQQQKTNICYYKVYFLDIGKWKKGQNM